jgi:hypothetical protein
MSSNCSFIDLSSSHVPHTERNSSVAFFSSAFPLNVSTPSLILFLVPYSFILIKTQDISSGLLSSPLHILATLAFSYPR